MEKYLQKYYKHIFIFLALLSVIAYVVTLITPKNITITKTIPVIPKTTPSKPPTTQIELQTSAPSLSLNFDTVTSVFPSADYPHYSYTPLLTPQSVIKMASTLGFTESDVKTVPTQDHLWSNDSGILLYVPKSNHLEYQNLKSVTTLGLFNASALSDKANQIIAAFFPNQQFEAVKVQYFNNVGTGHYQPTTSSRANLAEMKFHQTINNSPALSSFDSPDNLVIIFDTKLNINTMKISEGFSQANPTSTMSQPTLEKLKAINADKFKLYPNVTTDIGSSILSNFKLVLDIKRADIVYFEKQGSLQPYYLVTGSLISETEVFSNISYYTPVN